MQTYSCPNGCCKIYVNTYNNKNIKFYNRSSRRKAGVFIEDKSHNKVLLIQSNGNMWGPPKGTLKYGETDRICAIREVEEETGLKISTDDFKKALNIQNRAIYFYVEKDICPVEIPTKYIDNDVTGITWINPDCLEKIFDPFISESTIDIKKNETIFDALKQLPDVEIRDYGKNKQIISIGGEKGFYIYDVNGITPDKPIDEFKPREKVTINLKKLVSIDKKKIKINLRNKDSEK